MLRTCKILINHMSFMLPNTDNIFNDQTFTFSKAKIGLVGRNGIGKSTLLKLIIDEIQPHTGSIHVEGKLAYVSQCPIVPAEMTIAAFLGYAHKINALYRISQGSVNEDDFIILNEDWNVENRLKQQLATFGLEMIAADRQVSSLSGGEITKLMLVEAFSSDADYLLLDEPTNHLDQETKIQFYEAIKNWQGGLLVVSHDRGLLNLMEEIVELNTLGLFRYGGNYESYAAQKIIEHEANDRQIHDAKKLMKQTKRTIQLNLEKNEKKKSYGRASRKTGVVKMVADAKLDRNERSQNKASIRKIRLLNQAENQLSVASAKKEVVEEIHVDLSRTQVPEGKVILEIENLSFSYSSVSVPIIENFNLKIIGSERIALAGKNGSGKTTLIQLILNQQKMRAGKIYVGTTQLSYLDQSLEQLDFEETVLSNFMRLNPEIKIMDAYRALASFLFKNSAALKLVKNLSGGEKMRVMLACTLLSANPPQLLILDEPTNHLDLNSVRIIESALLNYQGAMIVISHDQQFLNNMGVKRIVYAPFINH